MIMFRDIDERIMINCPRVNKNTEEQQEPKFIRLNNVTLPTILLGITSQPGNYQ